MRVLRVPVFTVISVDKQKVVTYMSSTEGVIVRGRIVCRGRLRQFKACDLGAAPACHLPIWAAGISRPRSEVIILLMVNKF